LILLVIDAVLILGSTRMCRIRVVQIGNSLALACQGKCALPFQRPVFDSLRHIRGLDTFLVVGYEGLC